MLKRKGIEVEWGEDLGADEERALTQEFEKPFFIYGYPVKAKAFYHKTDPRILRSLYQQICLLQKATAKS